MKLKQLKSIIQKEIQTLKEQGGIQAPGPVVPSMGPGNTSSGNMGGVTSYSGPSVPSAACMGAINNFNRITRNMSPAGFTNEGMNENHLITENIWERFKGAIHKLATNCGVQYDMSGGPVGSNEGQ